MKVPPRPSILLLAALAGCGPQPFQVSSNADQTIAVAGKPGATPFIASLDLSGESLANVTSIAYSIQPKPGSVSKPVQVSYTLAALEKRGAVSETGVTLPVFGLYAGTDNAVTLELQASDGSKREVQVQITTQPYEDPEGVYDHPTVLQPRKAGTSLDFDFVALKSTRASVVVVDTDGAVRWVGTGAPSGATIFTDNGFVAGSGGSATVQRLELDGTITTSQVADPAIVDFTHNIDPGRVGLLGEFDVSGEFDATLEEFDTSGAVLHTWKLGDLLSSYMTSHGDDPTAFVRPGTDWFHLNAATYDPRDDSLIVSSRENFVMKIDYATGDLIWLLGDPTKYWYTFPSLRAKALSLTGGGFYPIGQHATSITSDGLLMVFNDGAASVNQPSGAPTGKSRSFAVVSAYAIDPAGMTATEAWRYEHQPEIDSDYCSSAYQTGQSLLVNYALSDGGSTVRLLGLDANRQVVFDIAYATDGCQTSWNAVTVPFDDLHFE